MLALLFSGNRWNLCSQWRIMPKSMLAPSGFPFLFSRPKEWSGTLKSSAVWWVSCHTVPLLWHQSTKSGSPGQKRTLLFECQWFELGTPVLRRLALLCLRHEYHSRLTQTFWGEERVTELWNISNISLSPQREANFIRKYPQTARVRD